MKSKIMFIALYSAAFMFPSIGSVDTAGAQTEHCAAFSGAPQVACEAAAQGAPATFDDGLMGAPAMGAPGMTGGTYAPGTMGHNLATGTMSAPVNSGGTDCGGIQPGTRERFVCENPNAYQ
ncbi:hypothetical protein N9L33_06375 [Nitrospinae bacterium]|nr:hypothetical protein [Nitrospinota bacterium]